ESLSPIAAENGAAWGDFLDRVSDLSARGGDLGTFVGCHSAADSENKAYQQVEAVLAAMGPQENQIWSNIEAAFREVSDDTLAAFVASDERLQKIEFWLEQRRRNARMRLPKDLEMLYADLAVDGIDAWGRTYDRIMGERKVDLQEKGEIVRKSIGRVRFDSPERTVRENNFHAVEKSWKEVADPCADALNHITGSRLTRYRYLGLQDHLDAPLHFNRMQRETLTAMWDVISKRKDPLLKFFKKKAELLGVEQMSWFDQMAPIPQAKSGDNKLSYDTACDTVIKTFTEFSNELGDFSQMAFDDRWIEVEDRSGKRPGGFCASVPTKKQSRIFMTYTGSPDDMSTLAHELGHAYHSYVLRDQPYFLRGYPMNLAETASTFAEAILGDRRLNDAATPQEKIGILNGMLTDSVAFMMNIHARFLFEDRFHVERRDGELPPDRLTALMIEAQKEAYCDAFAEWSEVFWISKLHFYITGLPFYNFPYTFGYLLSLGVYSTAEEFGSEFPAKYRELLIATGCKNAEDAVKSTLGYDLTKPDFWNKSIDIVDQRVEQFLQLADELL
ncbi:MAG: M3 family oligoendopeptidase, partial [Planctomycetaceae bacterium]|nr:M3 family oligoendopeptidase [Planctomycetaceae bacterium]